MTSKLLEKKKCSIFTASQQRRNTEATFSGLVPSGIGPGRKLQRPNRWKNGQKRWRYGRALAACDRDLAKTWNHYGKSEPLGTAAGYRELNSIIWRDEQFSFARDVDATVGFNFSMDRRWEKLFPSLRWIIKNVTVTYVIRR